jgi:phosphatidate cytidylyltransferase
VPHRRRAWLTRLGSVVNRIDFRNRVRAHRTDIERQVQATRAQFEATNQRIVAKSGRNLLGAIAIALTLGSVMIISLVVVKQLFMVFAGVVIAFTALELAEALRHAGRFVPRPPTFIAGLAVVPAAYYFNAEGMWLATVLGVLVVVVWRLVAEVPVAGRRASGEVFRDLGAAALIQVYVIFLASFSVLLVAQPDGQWWTLAFLVLVMLVDTGAYASGLSFGKHPMVPSISPKKTWEGFAGAAVVGVLGGVLLALFLLHQPWWVGVVFGVIIVVTATIGDLAESMIKRVLGVKDMSSWLPGHGGLLDRLDSILPSAAATYAIYLVFQ